MHIPPPMDDNLVDLSRSMESQSQGKKGRRSLKCDEVVHTRRICCNTRAYFDANTKVTLWSLKICWMVRMWQAHVGCDCMQPLYVYCWVGDSGRYVTV